MARFGRARAARVVLAGAALMMFGAGPALAAPVQCPSLPGETLVYIDVFDGPPEKLADLVPDQDSASGKAWNTWRLEAGPQGLFIQCGYGKSLAGPYSRMETLRLPDGVKSCRADYTTGPQPADATLVGFLCQ